MFKVRVRRLTPEQVQKAHYDGYPLVIPIGRAPEPNHVRDRATGNAELVVSQQVTAMTDVEWGVLEASIGDGYFPVEVE